MAVEYSFEIVDTVDSSEFVGIVNLFEIVDIVNSSDLVLVKPSPFANQSEQVDENHSDS